MADKPNYTELDSEALTAALDEIKAKKAEIFALDTPTIAQVDEVEALVASGDAIQAEIDKRDAIAEEAGKRFAAAKAAFTADASGTDAGDEGDDGDDGDADDAEDGDEDAGDDADGDDGDEGDDGDGDGDGAVTASVDPVKGQKIPMAKVSTAKAVGRRTKNRKIEATNTDVVITASASVGDLNSGDRISGMDGVTTALLERVKGFPKHNKAAARTVRAQNGGVPSIEQRPLVKFGGNTPETMTAAVVTDDYSAVRAAIKGRDETALADPADALAAAGGWCAPSQTVYSYISDYVVDGLITVPEVSAPRGGLMLTTGPAKSTQGQALKDFGFVQTEAEAIAGEEKDIETIVCPEFVDHRLDAIGYGVTIPLLTQKAYPELITDMLKLSGVMYAHKVNQRVIEDIVALSTPLGSIGLGATFTDTLEALAVTATRRRRKWNLGDNAIMEVKLPQIAREIFRADMSRRNGLALSDIATDAKIRAEFVERRLAVEYIADWQEEETDADAATLPTSIQALIYPSGTFIKAIEDVVNLSAIYDAASLTVNEYLGVFFEQGILVAKAGYGSDLVTIPVCTAGLTGANSIDCFGAGSV